MPLEKDVAISRSEFFYLHETLLQFAELKDRFIQSNWKSDPKKFSRVEENLVKKLDSVLEEFSVSHSDGIKIIL